ncbi:MAG: hypothetical protein MJB12_10815, partial [Firmicutes bacterium]|nr:hypothetical protein [Bacillota bacterium]
QRQDVVCGGRPGLNPHFSALNCFLTLHYFLLPEFIYANRIYILDNNAIQIYNQKCKRFQ